MTNNTNATPCRCERDGLDKRFCSAACALATPGHAAGAEAGWFLPLDAVNSIQADTINRLVRRAKGAHHADVDLRINGQNEHYEADWIKHMRWVESTVPASGTAAAVDSDARDAARYRWLKQSATPGQRPHASELPLGYQSIRLRVDTAVYSPATWGEDIDRLIDAAMKERP